MSQVRKMPEPIGSMIKVPGPRLVITNAHILKEQGCAAIDAGARDLTIDLAEVEFIDSSGIGVLVGLRKRLPDGRLALSNVTGFVTTVLEMTRTGPLFDILD